MKVGVFTFLASQVIPANRLAHALEERGFDALFVCEHTHIPINDLSKLPQGPAIREQYISSYDPLIALTLAASATSRLRLGTSISLIGQRDPIVFAKQVASLDQISNGRVTLGIGSGWLAEELWNHGIHYTDRFRVMREHTLAVRNIWSNDVAEFSGEFVNFRPMRMGPKPVQSPLPILLGGETDHTLRRVVEFCDGWMPRVHPLWDPTREMRRLASFADEAGRDMSVLSVTALGVPCEQEVWNAYEEAGIERVLVSIPGGHLSDVLRYLDHLASKLY